MNTLISSLRATLADELEQTAAWRRRKAAQYPNGSRDESAACRLEEWAKEVRLLPDDDAAFAPAIAHAQTRDGSDSSNSGVAWRFAIEVQEPASRVGFEDGVQSLRELLTLWAASVDASFHGHPPSH